MGVRTRERTSASARIVSGIVGSSTQYGAYSSSAWQTLIAVGTSKRPWHSIRISAFPSVAAFTAATHFIAFLKSSGGSWR